MPESHLAYFHPDGFGRADLTAVLRSRSFMTYGLFVEDALAAYALLMFVLTVVLCLYELHIDARRFFFVAKQLESPETAQDWSKNDR